MTPSPGHCDGYRQQLDKNKSLVSSAVTVTHTASIFSPLLSKHVLVNYWIDKFFSEKAQRRISFQVWTLEGFEISSPVFRQGFKLSNIEYLQHKSNKMIHSLTSVGILFWIPGTLVQSHFRDPDKDFVSRAEALYFSHFNTTKVRCSSVNCGLSTILL